MLISGFLPLSPAAPSEPPVQGLTKAQEARRCVESRKRGDVGLGGGRSNADEEDEEGIDRNSYEDAFQSQNQHAQNEVETDERRKSGKRRCGVMMGSSYCGEAESPTSFNTPPLSTFSHLHSPHPPTDPKLACSHQDV